MSEAPNKDIETMTNDKLASEYNAGMCWEAMCGDVWTPANEARLKALEAEIDRREKAGTWEVCEDD